MSVETLPRAVARPDQAVELFIGQKVLVTQTVHELPLGHSPDGLGSHVRDASTISGTIKALPAELGQTPVPDTIHIDQGEGQPTAIVPLWSSEFADVMRGKKRPHKLVRLRVFGIEPLEDSYSS